jgi:protease-4
MFWKSKKEDLSNESFWKRYRLTRRLIKYGILSTGVVAGYYWVQRNFLTETMEPILPNTILYVKTSQISQEENSFGRAVPSFEKWIKYGFQTIRNKQIMDPRDKYLEVIEPKYSFNDYIMSLERAMHDDRIIGIVLDVDNIHLGAAQTQELRTTLQRLLDPNRPNAKRICLSYADKFASYNAYWLASVFPRIFFHPNGYFVMPHTSSRLFYIKDLLNRLGIDVHKFSRDDHKHFGNSLVYSGTEEEFNTENQLKNEVRDVESLRHYFFNLITEDVAQARKKPIAVKNQIENDKVYETVANLLTHRFTADEAIKFGLVDSICYQDSIFTQVIPQYMNEDKGPKNEKKPNIISLEDYTTSQIIELNQLLLKKQKEPTEKKNKSSVVNIGVITFQGSINEATCNNLLSRLNKARYSNDFDTVLFRVTSPGGDTIVADTLRHHIELIKNTGKRVIVSMGNVAASGGYYMALPADKIVAMRSSITGSIGVVALRPIISETMLQKYGIRMKKVLINDDNRSDVFEPIDSQEREEMNRILDSMYENFIEQVAKNRKLTKEQAHMLAKGKVYTGGEAFENGLIDEIGGFKDAIDLARRGDINDKSSFKRPYVLYPINSPMEGVLNRLTTKLWTFFKTNISSNTVSYESKTEIDS